MKKILKFQRPLFGPAVILVYDELRSFQTTLPLTKDLDNKLFPDLAVVYRECEVSGDKIVTIGSEPAEPYIRF